MTATGAAPEASAPRVLVAEDETHLGLLLEHFLVARGCVVTVVRDGHEALARLTGGERFDVALLDVQMPRLDGLGVLRGLQRRPLGPEVILASGNAGGATVDEALRLGAWDVVAKPYRMAEIERMVRRAAAFHALRRARAAQEWAERVAADAVAADPALADAVAQVDALAASAGPVVLVGAPTATLVGLAARLHRQAGPGGAWVVADLAAPPLAGLAPAALADRLLGGVPATAPAPGGASARPRDAEAPLCVLAAGGTLVVAGTGGLGTALLDRLVAAARPAAPAGPQLVLLAPDGQTPVVAGAVHVTVAPHGASLDRGVTLDG